MYIKTSKIIKYTRRGNQDISSRYSRLHKFKKNTTQDSSRRHKLKTDQDMAQAEDVIICNTSLE